MADRASRPPDSASPGDPTRRDFLKTTCAAAGLLACGGLPGLAAAPAADLQTARKGLIRARPSPWFTRLDDGRLRCTLCPKACRLAAGKRGVCRVRENRNGVGHTLVFGNPAILQTDPIERKPFYHVLPGSRSLSVATAGCNFSCRFCQVWDMAQSSPEDVHAYDVPPADVVRHARNAGAQSIAFTYGEPVAFFEYMLETSRLARRAGLLTLFHSNGFIKRAPLRELCRVLDGANISLKGFSPAFYRDTCGGELAPVLTTLKALRAAGVHLEITTILIPTLNDRPRDLRRLARWVREELGSRTPLHFARFYPLFQLANLPPTPVATLEAAHAMARREGLEHVYIANVPGHAAESTFCPKCGGRAIERLGFVVETMRLENGRCAACGHAVPGIWRPATPRREAT